MALDHRRLIRPGKKIRPNFLRSTSLLNKILPSNLGACKPTFYTIYKTSHLRWNSTMRHCFHHTDLGQNAVFHNLRYKVRSFNIQDDRSMRELLAKPFKKISKTIYGKPVLTFKKRAVVVFEWTLSLQHNKEFITVIFYLMVLSMSNLQIKAFDTRGILSTPASDVHWTTERHSD